MPGPDDGRWKRYVLVDSVFMAMIWIVGLASVYAVRTSGDTVWTGHRLWVGAEMENSLDGQWSGTARIEPEDAPFAVVEIDDSGFDAGKSEINTRGTAGYVPAVWLEVTDKVESATEGKPIVATVFLSVSVPTEGSGGTFGVESRSHEFKVEVTPERPGPLHGVLLALDDVFWLALVGIALLFGLCVHLTWARRSASDLAAGDVRNIKAWLVTLAAISAALIFWKALGSEVDRRAIILVMNGVGAVVGGGLLVCLLPGFPWFLRFTGLERPAEDHPRAGPGDALDPHRRHDPRRG